MSRKTYAMAIRDTLAEEMRRDNRVFVMGEDVEPRRKFIEENAQFARYLDI